MGGDWIGPQPAVGTVTVHGGGRQSAASCGLEDSEAEVWQAESDCEGEDAGGSVLRSLGKLGSLVR